jgi:hypothetical protein
VPGVALRTMMERRGFAPLLARRPIRGTSAASGNRALKPEDTLGYEISVECTSRLSLSALLVLAVALVTNAGCNSSSNSNTNANGTGQVLKIDPNDDSCKPVRSKFQACAQVCEVNPLRCAKDILKHVESPGFIRRRQLNPGTIEEKPNIQAPMHGMFVPVWNNPQLNDAINQEIAHPLDPIVMPDWSISAKLNNSPGVTSKRKTSNNNPHKLHWATVMYKIPGYCPPGQLVFPAGPGNQCKGGNWFFFLYRNGFISFDFDAASHSSEPAFGKADAFCVTCHASVADADWLWITQDLVRRQQQLDVPVSTDGHTPGSTGAGICDNVTSLSPNRPADVLFDPASLPSVEEAHRMFNCYGWETFVALFWPAVQGQSGVPDTTKPITDPSPRVWETYKQTYEMFQPGQPAWSLSNQQWNETQPLPAVCTQALQTAKIQAASILTFEVLNETHQAFGSQFNTLIDQNGNEVHYNVRINQDEFEFLKQGGYADTGTYDYNGPLGSNKRFFRMPDITHGVTGEGATEVKSAWKVMCTDPKTCNHVDDPSRYFTRTALIYTPAVTRVVNPFKQNGALPRPTVTTPETCKVAQVGLVGFHIAAKTFWAPQWIWPTFEQVDNVPGNTAAGEQVPASFSFFDPSVPATSLDQCIDERPGIIPPDLAKNPALAYCPNQQNIDNSRPDPGNKGDLVPLFPSGFLPTQVTLLDPIGNDTTEVSVGELNTLFRGLLAQSGSPLQYYVMVSTQWPANGRKSQSADPSFGITNKLCLDPNGSTADCVTFLPDELRLRNTAIETYDMSYCRPENQDIGDDPASCTPDGVTVNPHQHSSGGCMNCHFNAGTDSSFIWSDGIEEQVPLQ